MLPFIPQLAVGIILDDGNAVPLGQEHQFVPSSLRQRHPSRILKVREDIHELRPGAQRLLQSLGLKSVVIDGNGDVFGAINIESLQRAQVGRRLDQQAVTWIDQQFRDQIERLL